MTYAIGIDPSLTGTAVCSLDPVNMTMPCIDTFSSKPADGLVNRFERFGNLVSEIFEEMPLENGAVIAIEGYSFASKGGKAFDRVEFGALLRNQLLKLGVAVYEVPPSSLKLFAAGKGNADKTAMALAVFKRWGQELRDDNQVDAYALARMAACIAGFDQPQTDAQKRAIDSVLHGKPK